MAEFVVTEDMLDNVAAHLGYELTAEEVAARLPPGRDWAPEDLPGLRAELDDLQARLTERGGRGIELADRIDALRIELAVAEIVVVETLPDVTAGEVVAANAAEPQKVYVVRVVGDRDSHSILVGGIGVFHTFEEAERVLHTLVSPGGDLAGREVQRRQETGPGLTAWAEIYAVRPGNGITASDVVASYDLAKPVS